MNRFVVVGIVAVVACGGWVIAQHVRPSGVAGLRDFDRKQAVAFPDRLTNVVQCDGSLWVANRSEDGDWSAPERCVVRRIDPVTGAVMATIAVEPESAQLAAGEGAVWVRQHKPALPFAAWNRSAPSRTVLKIDPKANRVVDGIAADAGVVRTIAAGAGALWLASDRPRVQPGAPLPPRAKSFVVRIDPSTLRPVANVPLDQEVAELAVGAGAVWVLTAGRGLHRDAELLRIDPRSNSVAGKLPLRAIDRLAVGAGAVWVTSLARTRLVEDKKLILTRIDPTTLETRDAQLPLAKDPKFYNVAGDPVATNLAASDDAVWLIANTFPTWSLVRADPERMAIVAGPVGYPSTSLLSTGECGVWASVFSPRAAMHGPREPLVGFLSNVALSP